MITQDYTQASSQIEGKRKGWKRNFSGNALNTDAWQVSGSAGAIAYSVSGGQLVVNMNTGINQELILTSTEAFALPFRAQWHIGISQRIANNEIFLELVNQSGQTYQGWKFDGLVTTAAAGVHMTQGASSPASPIAIGTVTATSATATIREIEVRAESVEYTDRNADSNATSTSRAVRTRTTMDPEEKYFVRMRFKNLGTAPATNTVVTIEQVLVQDINDVLVEISGGRGNNSPVKAVPVMVQGTAPVSLASQSIAPTVSSTVGTSPTVTRIGALTNVASSVKATAGKVFGIVMSNPNTTPVWFNVYNTVAPVIGTTTPLLQYLVPANDTRDAELPFGANMPTAIVLAATDNSAPMSAIAPTLPVVACVIWI